MARPTCDRKSGYYHVNSGPRRARDVAIPPRAAIPSRPTRGGESRLNAKFGRVSIERLLSTSERAHKHAERVLAQAPRSDRTRKIAKDLDRTGVRLDFLRRYHSLYKEYAQSELHFVDDNTLALTQALHPDDQAAFASIRQSLTCRPTSRTCTVHRSPRRFVAWTLFGVSAAAARPP